MKSIMTDATYWVYMFSAILPAWVLSTVVACMRGIKLGRTKKETEKFRIALIGAYSKLARDNPGAALAIIEKAIPGEVFQKPE